MKHYRIEILEINGGSGVEVDTALIGEATGDPELVAGVAEALAKRLRLAAHNESPVAAAMAIVNGDRPSLPGAPAEPAPKRRGRPPGSGRTAKAAASGSEQLEPAATPPVVAPNDGSATTPAPGVVNPFLAGMPGA